MESGLIAYLIFLFLWMLSPGPCFALNARNSMKYGIKAGFWTAFGMVVCDTIFIIFAVLGVAEFLNHYPKVLNAGKMIGGAYIFYIGIDIFFTTFKKKDLTESDVEGIKNTPKKLFIKGFLTDASNPLLIIGMLAIVISYIDLSGGVNHIIFYSALIPFTTIYVNAIISVCFGNPLIRRVITPYIVWVERIAGFLLCTLAIMMIIE